MPQSILLPAAGSAGSASQNSHTTSDPARSGTARTASSGGRFDDCLNNAQQSSNGRQNTAASKKTENSVSATTRDKSSYADKVHTVDKADKADKAHKADKKDKASVSKDKKDHTVDSNTDPVGSSATKPKEVTDDAAAGDKTLTTKASATDGVVDGKAPQGAGDDPWLQQIEASRQTLQSPKVSQATLTPLNPLTGVAGVSGQVSMADLDASGKLNQSAEQMAAALNGAGAHKVDATSVSSQHTESALHILLGTDEQGEKSSSKLDSMLLDATKTTSNQGADTAVTPAHLHATSHDFLDSLRQVQGNNNGLSTLRQPEPQAPTPLPLRHPEQSAQALQEQVQFLLNRKLDTVEIRLDPPELGNLQIKLHLNQDQAQVGIVVHNSHARELLEQTLPRLREMLAQQGIQLGQTQIQQQSQQQQGGGSGNGQDLRGTSGGSAGSTLSNGDDGDADAALSVQQHTVSGSAHAVDYYA